MVITIMSVFIDMKENWTRRPQQFQRMEENFSMNLFDIPCLCKAEHRLACGWKTTY